jgi:hypothetical protein
MHNDITMFKRNGLSIAMGNACPELQRTATYVTASNEKSRNGEKKVRVGVIEKGSADLQGRFSKNSVRMLLHWQRSGNKYLAIRARAPRQP